MGEAKSRSRNRDEVLGQETRCIYCVEGKPNSLEHMPPRAMFTRKIRPSGMEFACCAKCNQGTKTADLIASFISKLGADKSAEAELAKEAENLLRRIARIAPDAMSDFASLESAKRFWRKRESGFFQDSMRIEMKSPTLHSYLDTFSAKLGMAIYREVVGEPLPGDGAVFSLWFLNGGLAQKTGDEMLKILPVYGTLTQGIKTAAGQYDARYNTDHKEITASLTGFHRNFYVFNIATSNVGKYGKSFVRLHETKSVLKPGELLGHLSASAGAYHSRTPDTSKP